MDTPGKRLAHAREKANYRSARQAAINLNVPVSTYNAHERAGEPGGRQFSLSEAEKYARNFRVSASWLLLGKNADAPPITVALSAPPAITRPTEQTNMLAPFPVSPYSDRRIPVYGRAVGGDEGKFEFNGERMGDVFCPPILDGVPEAYAVEVAGESMTPRFRPGETVWVNPRKSVHRGDDVVVQMHPAEPDGTVEGYIKEYVTITPTMLVLRQYNPAKEIELDRRIIKSVHKVVFHGVAS